MSDLAHCKMTPAVAEEETVSTQHLTTWKHQTAFKSTEFSMVWVQGEVTYAEVCSHPLVEKNHHATLNNFSLNLG